MRTHKGWQDSLCGEMNQPEEREHHENPVCATNGLSRGLSAWLGFGRDIWQRTESPSLWRLSASCVGLHESPCAVALGSCCTTAGRPPVPNQWSPRQQTVQECRATSADAACGRLIADGFRCGQEC